MFYYGYPLTLLLRVSVEVKMELKHVPAGAAGCIVQKLDTRCNQNVTGDEMSDLETICSYLPLDLRNFNPPN